MSASAPAEGARDKDAAAALTERNRARLARASELLARIAAEPRPPTRASVLEPLDDLLLELANLGTECGLLSEVHPDAAVREAAEAMDREGTTFRTTLLQDRALHRALERIDPAGLDAVAVRVRRLVLQDMRRSGVGLDEAGRARVRALSDELQALGQEFSRVIRDDVRSIEVTDEELAGLPADYVAAHPANASGRRVVTTNYPDTIPFMAYSRSDAARRRLSYVNQNRGTPRNLEVLGAMLAKRQELARLLGYASWAEYATADKMTGSAQAAREFIERAYDAARESGQAEKAQILAKKREADPATATATIGSWEHAYWVERIKAETFRFDPRSVRPYFEYSRVRGAILDLASRLFALTFTKVEQPDIWHPSVDTYDVTVDGRRAGRISLDMHPREGKYKHAACFTWQPGIRGKQEPHLVLVCNFPDPAATSGPALMEHSEVVTFFHEFGHLVHFVLVGANAPWVRTAAPTEWDFIEAPSQLLEEWIYDAGVLRGFARHVETGEPIPEEVVTRLREARDFGRGVFVQRQLFLAAVALALHEREAVGLDTTKLVFELARTYSPTVLLPDTRFEASFGHLEGYTALYYTYMFSAVIARDLLTAFSGGLLDLAQATRYRDLVLAPGGTKPAAELVADFLGRPYGFDAFREWLAPRPGTNAGAP